MKTILLFGAGKSATILIDYLINNAVSEDWQIIVIDANLKLAESKIGNSKRVTAYSFDINDTDERGKYINKADIVISMLPPFLHIEVAKDCVKYKKNLLTASYVDDATKGLKTDIEKSNLLFLYEMGLDPGIDHMSAMKIIDAIHAKGGKVSSFQSHCGGLVAPESDDNPWHFKISWNPRNIVLAGKSGAIFKENGEEKRMEYEELFSSSRQVEIPTIGLLSWYPNRDSLGYTSLYGLEDVPTFIRTTLRHPDFMYGWKNIIELKLIDETVKYETDGKSLQQVFKEHLDKNDFSGWLNQHLPERLAESKGMIEDLMDLKGAEKNNTVEMLAYKMGQTNLILKQLFFLGLDDAQTELNKGLCSAADILQFAVEKKMALKPDDKDMIVMLHQIEYDLNGKKAVINSSMVVKGENSMRTAMAKTVGLPLGIATKLILNGTIRLSGLQIPTSKEIYEPVLKELESYGVQFIEEF